MDMLVVVVDERDLATVFDGVTEPEQVVLVVQVAEMYHEKLRV